MLRACLTAIGKLKALDISIVCNVGTLRAVRAAAGVVVALRGGGRGPLLRHVFKEVLSNRERESCGG